MAVTVAALFGLASLSVHAQPVPPNVPTVSTPIRVEVPAPTVPEVLPQVDLLGKPDLALQVAPLASSLATIGVSFQASELFVDSNFIPPDTMGAVGPNHIMELINGNYEIFDKAGTSLVDRI